jgi:hypothetical protein
MCECHDSSFFNNYHIEPEDKCHRGFLGQYEPQFAFRSQVILCIVSLSTAIIQTIADWKQQASFLAFLDPGSARSR